MYIRPIKCIIAVNKFGLNWQCKGMKHYAYEKYPYSWVYFHFDDLVKFDMDFGIRITME